MKKIILAGILGLAACGETSSEFDPNQADVTSAEIDGQMVVTGHAGSSFTEAEIDDFIIAPECELHGMKVESKTVTVNPDGTLAISAICV